MLGGNVPAYFRLKRTIALTYCSPRNTSSASRSRRMDVRHMGRATLIMRHMALMLTSNAAIA